MSTKRKTNPPSAQLNLCPHVISQLLQDRLKLIESSFLPLLLSLPGVYSVFFWGLFSEQPITTLQTEMMMVFLYKLFYYVLKMSPFISVVTLVTELRVWIKMCQFQCCVSHWTLNSLAADNWWCPSPSPHPLLQSGQVNFGVFDTKYSLSTAFPTSLCNVFYPCERCASSMWHHLRTILGRI